MKRYSHTAIVTILTGHMVDGEYIAGDPIEVEVVGSYFASNSSNKLKMNPQGVEEVVHGEFSTKHPVLKNAGRLSIANQGVDSKIICWEPFQSHSVIYI